MVDLQMNLCCKLLVLALLGTVAMGFLSVDPASFLLKDEHHRTRVMHGLNVVYKQFPFYPGRAAYNSNDSLVAEDFANLKKWGFNSLRLYMAWEGFEPKRSEYNYTYLQALRDIVREAETYGISVILDAHHDLYSRKFCGEGFPSWLVVSNNFPAPYKLALRRDADGNPLKEDCLKMPFFKFYLSYDVVSFSHDFFTNKHGMNDKFVEMWVKVVEYFKGEANVIGYDVVNEPTGGNFWKNPYSFLGPDQNNNRFLLPFYRKLSKEVRKIDRDRLLLFEPSPQDMIGGFFGAFSDNSTKDLLNYHTYCPFSKKLGSSRCDLFNSVYVSRRQKNAKQLGVGAIISEFGSVANNAEGCAELKSVVAHADKYLTSWYYWQFKYNNDSTCSTSPPWLFAFYYPNGTLQTEKVRALSYSYAYAICGRVISQTAAEGSYSLSLFPAQCLNQKHTELFLNEQWDFATGFVLKFTPDCEKCRLRFISKGYYELVVEEAYLGKALTVSVGARLS